MPNEYTSLADAIHESPVSERRTRGDLGRAQVSGVERSEHASPLGDDDG